MLLFSTLGSFLLDLDLDLDLIGPFPLYLFLGLELLLWGLYKSLLLINRTK